jgi:hypothetical protein
VFSSSRLEGFGGEKMWSCDLPFAVIIYNFVSTVRNTKSNAWMGPPNPKRRMGRSLDITVHSNQLNNYVKVIMLIISTLHIIATYERFICCDTPSVPPLELKGRFNLQVLKNIGELKLPLRHQIVKKIMFNKYWA